MKKIIIRPKKLIYFIIFFTVIMGALIDEFHLPRSITYLNDVCVILLLFFCLKRIKFWKYIHMSFFPITMAGLFTVLLFGVIINLVPIRLVIWGTRNTFRCFVFLYAAIIYLDMDDLDCIFDKLYKLQWINLILALYQYYVLGLSQDSLGGIFGHGAGAGLTSFSCLLLSYHLCAYFYKKISLFKMVFVVGTTLITCTLAEEKMFFFEFVIILISVFLFSKFSLKKLVGIIVGSLFFLGGLQLMKYILPWSYERIVNFEKFIEYGQSTTGGYNISRFGAFSEINDIFLKNNILKNLFGYGLGNCEYASFPIFLSDFYRTYGWYNYRWFAHQWMFLETGYLGLIAYIMVIVGFLVYGVRHRFKLSEHAGMYNVVGQCMAVITVVSMWCNALVKVDYSYIPFFGIALIGIAVKTYYYENKTRIS